MIIDGLSLAARYSYPPNSLSLCGPQKQKELSWYSANQKTDPGTKEILEQFSTLYPYLCFIAGENHVKNPFETKVIEAYWLGNSLLRKTNSSDFMHFLDEDLTISKKILKNDNEIVRKKISMGAVPHHAFHVLNIYRRTGHMDIAHTIETMDACIINAGKIVKILDKAIIVDTQPLRIVDGKVTFGNTMQRKLRIQGDNDLLFPTLSIDDWVSYHWGYICEKITPLQRKNLFTYTNLAINFANTIV